MRRPTRLALALGLIASLCLSCSDGEPDSDELAYIDPSIYENCYHVERRDPAVPCVVFDQVFCFDTTQARTVLVIETPQVDENCVLNRCTVPQPPPDCPAVPGSRRACVLNSDCPGGEYCCGDQGTVCIAEGCELSGRLEGQSCRNDGDCRGELVCPDGTCQSTAPRPRGASCREDNDCQRPLWCLGGVCSDFPSCVSTGCGSVCGNVVDNCGNWIWCGDCPYCGDWACEHGENCLSCSFDCGWCDPGGGGGGGGFSYCGDGYCDWWQYEDEETCPTDCGG